MRRFCLLLLPSLLWLALAGGAFAGRDTFKVRPEPKVERYDWERDDFVVRESVLTPRRKTRAAYGYRGNRLNRFQFLGPEEQSGIYGGLRDFQRERMLDPTKY